MIRPSQQDQCSSAEHTSAHCWSELAELLTRCCRLIRAHLAEHTDGHDISDAQFSLLWLCARAPDCGISQNELVTELGMSAAHVSGSVERLRQKGLLSGQRSKSDRRRQLWQLTPAGKAALQAVLDDLGTWAKRLNEQLSVERRDHLASLLEDLAHALSTAGALSSPGKDSANQANGSRRDRRKPLVRHEGGR